MADKENTANPTSSKEIQKQNHDSEKEQIALTNPNEEQNYKQSYWDSPEAQKEVILFPRISMDRKTSIPKQGDNLKTSSTQLFYSDINLLQRAQLSQDDQILDDKPSSNLKDQQSFILQGYDNEAQTNKNNRLLNNIQETQENDLCENNNLYNNEIGSPQCQPVIGQKSLQKLQNLQKKLSEDDMNQDLNKLASDNNKGLLNKGQKGVSGNVGGSLDDLVSAKSSAQSERKKVNHFSEVPNTKNLKEKQINNHENEPNDQSLTQFKFIHKQKTLTEKIIDKIANIVNGSQNQTFAEEDKHLQKQQNEQQYSKQIEGQEKASQQAQNHRKSIRLYTLKKIKRRSQVDSMSSIQDFDQIINQKNPELVGVKRRTYTEFNSLMKQQTLDYDLMKEKEIQEQGYDEEDGQEENDDKSDINSINANQGLGQTQEQADKKKNKSKRFRKKKQVQTDENGVLVPVEAEKVVKYDYPFPYNLKIQEKEEEEQFRLVDDELRDEYEFYSKKQIAKQDKNREQIIYAVKKNEFEMLTLLADHYPLLQLRKMFLLICRFISWLAYKIIKHRWFERIVLFVIIFNTIIQCMDDPTSDSSTPVLDTINLFFLIAYTVECSLKILGLGFIMNKGSYLRDGWNVLDFTIVFTSLLPYMIGAESGVNLSSLRSLRVLRPLKTISKIKSLKIVLLALFSSFPYLVNAIIILVFFYLIFAIAGVQLFMGLLKRRCFDPATGIILAGNDDQPCGGQYTCPGDYVCGKMFENPIYGVFNFDNILSSFLMVFVCVTLESWTQIMYYVFDSFTSITVIYFVVLCFIGAFFLINLTLAVIKAKFTKPEDYVEPENNAAQEIIDMHRLKMFRRMERNHLRRKLLAKKQVLLVGAQDLDIQDDGLFFNWEDLMKLKLIQDKEDEEMAQQEEKNQALEKQNIMKQKLKQKLKKAIKKDILLKQFRYEGQKQKQLPNQKIVFYVGKQHGEIISQSTINEIENYYHQQNHSKKRGSIRQTFAYGSKMIGLGERSKRQIESRQNSIQFQVEPIQQKKDLQKIQFLGVQRGAMTPIKGSAEKYEKHKSYAHSRTSISNNQKQNNIQHHSALNRQSSINCMNTHQHHNNLVNEEEDQQIFDRFDEINRIEIEEFKKYDKENGRVDMDEFSVINNLNLKRLRKLPEIQTSLSILSLKNPKPRNSGEVSEKSMNGFKNLKSIITEDNFTTTQTHNENSSEKTRVETTKTYDQISKQITKTSLKSTNENILYEKESFAKLNQQLQEIHEQKQSTAGIMNTEMPLQSQNNQNAGQSNQENIDDFTFQDIGIIKTSQQEDLKTNENYYNNDKLSDQNCENKLITLYQKQINEEDRESSKSLGIVDQDSIESGDYQKYQKNVSNPQKNKRSPTTTPNKKITSKVFKFGSIDEQFTQNGDEYQKISIDKPALYDEEEDDEDEDLWVEQNAPVRNSTILKNFYNYQLNVKKDNDVAQEEQVQQSEKTKKPDTQKNARLEVQGKVGSLIQIQLNKKKIDRKQTIQYEVQANKNNDEESLNQDQLAQKGVQKKNAGRRASRASVHHNLHNLEAQLAGGQRDQGRATTVIGNRHFGKKSIKPLQNVRHWKIMIDTKKEYKSNSQSDILYHRLKAEQDNKIEEEQVKIRNTKYLMCYRQRTIKKLSKRALQRMKKDKKKQKKSKKGSKGLSRSVTITNKPIGNKSSGQDSDSSYSRSTTDNFDLSLYILQQELQNKNTRFPVRRSQVQEQLSSSCNDVLDFEEQSVGSHIKNNQMNSFASNYSSQLLMRSRMRSKQARIASTKEKIVFNYDTIKKLLQENVIKPQYKAPLDSVTNKSVYWDIRRFDYNLGMKNMNIWSGSNVCRAIYRNKQRSNKILKQLCTEQQDLHVWVSGFKGLVSVIHKHFKNYILSNSFNGLSMLCVFMNTTVLAMNGSFSDQESLDILQSLNDAFSYIFIAEMGLKIIALGPLGYVRDKINLFDGLIVSISIIEMVVFSGGKSAVSAFRAVRIFRTFRVLRVTRLLRSLQFMSVIMSVINRTIDSFMYIALLLFLFIFIYSLLGMQIYGGQLNFKDNGGIRQNFDSFFNSFLATFQIVTLENWPDILITTMRSPVHPAITSIYLVSWIFIGNYVFLNLFLAILLDGFVQEGDEEEHQLENQEEEDGDESDIDEQIQSKILKMSKKAIREEKKKQYDDQELLLEIKQQQQQFEIDSDTNLEQLFEEKVNKQVNLFHGIECRDSLFIFPKTNWLRIQCYKLAQLHQFENFILILIITSSLKLVVDTYLDEANEAQQTVSNDIDYVFNGIFTLECAIKIIAYGLLGDDNSYLTDSWSQLDFFIVLASLLDMSVQSINLPVIKILRLLRTLRPLRFISHNVNMKVVVIALFESVGAIANVLVVVLLIWLMFAILGISLIGERMGYCDVPNYYKINKTTCLSMGKSWRTFDTNFDNITNSMITLLILSTLENWPNMMFQALDSDTSDNGPSFMGYSIISAFYIVFILIGSFFLINLFIGVIFLKFTEAQKSQKISIFLTEKQARWIEFQMMIIGVKAQFQQNKKPDNQFRLFFWKIVNHQAFDLFIMLCIVANIFTMGLTYEGSSSSWDQNLSYVNYFFTAVFITEMVLKVLSLGFATYFQNGWNKFDFFVVCSSIVDITMDMMGGQSLSFLRVGPQLARVVRVFRVTRLLKLVRSMRGLQKLIETLIFSLPSLVNVGALMLLFYFIFSVLGVFLFQDIVKGQTITSYNNFANFGNAMITLFRSSTGENWQLIMFDVSDQNNCRAGGTCYTSFAKIYFVFFILVCVFIMLNLFILVLIQYFEDYHMKEDNPLDAFNENLEIFRSVWANYTAFSNGVKINTKHIVNFLSELPTPLGYLEENIEDFDDRIDKHQIAKDVMEMKLPDDGFGNIFFNDCLFACMKKAYGADIVNDGAVELKKFLIKQEYETKKKIEEKKRQLLIKQKQRIFNDIQNVHVNPIVLMLFCGMAFKSWKNYIELIKNDDGAIDKEYSMSSSSSSESEDSDDDSDDGDIDYDEEDDEDDDEDDIQIYDENGNPIDVDEDDLENLDEMHNQQDKLNGSHKSLEGIHEHSSEDEADEEENTKRKRKITIQKSKQNIEKRERKRTASNLNKLTVQTKAKEETQSNKNNMSQQQIEDKQEIYQDVDTKQTYNFNPKNNPYGDLLQLNKKDSNSESDTEKKEEVIERGGYDENEDFNIIQEKEKKWKQMELEIIAKNNLLKLDDKDQSKNFLKTPKHFDDDEDSHQYEDIDTPIHFKKKHSKKNKNKQFNQRILQNKEQQ